MSVLVTISACMLLLEVYNGSALDGSSYPSPVGLIGRRNGENHLLASMIASAKNKTAPKTENAVRIPHILSRRFSTDMHVHVQRKHINHETYYILWCLPIAEHRLFHPRCACTVRINMLKVCTVVFSCAGKKENQELYIIQPT